jgi:hypothetical protein
MDIGAVRKAELHCHVDGLLNPKILDRLGDNGPARELRPALLRLCPVQDLRSWAEEYCPTVSAVLTNRGEFLLDVLAEYLRSLKRQNVVYPGRRSRTHRHPTLFRRY